MGRRKTGENLEASVLRLTALRQGLNLAHILRDPVKRGGSPLPCHSDCRRYRDGSACSGIVIFHYDGLGAGGGAGGCTLSLEGGKVPLVKSSSQWKLDLQGLLDLGAKGRLPDGIGKGEKEEEGLDHKGYLRLMLLEDTVKNGFTV